MPGPTSATVYGAPAGHDARILADFARKSMAEDRAVMHIALDDMRLHQLQEWLAFFAPEAEIVLFPAWDCLPYDRVSPNNEITAARVAALSRLLAWRAESKRYPRIILTTVNAAVQRVMPREALKGVSLQIVRGGRLDLAHLQNFFGHNGYLRTDTVREAGEFAIRGGIIDLFPAGAEDPVRIDLFGEDVESIRHFDPASQRSGDSLNALTLQPAAEFSLTEESVNRFRIAYRETFGVVRDDDPLYEAVSNARRYNGMDHWLPLFYPHLETIFDYAPDAQITGDFHVAEAVAERLSQIHDFFEARQSLKQASARKQKKSGDVSLSGAVYNPLPPTSLYMGEAQWAAQMQGLQSFSPFGAPEGNYTDAGGRKGRDFADIRAVPGADVLASVKEYLAAAAKQTAIACYTEGSRERLKGLLDNAGIGPLVMCADYRELTSLKPGQIGLIVLGLEDGFQAEDLIVLTEQDILGDRLVRKQKKRRRADNFLTEVSSLAEGDLVVHIDHGVGRFIALETVEAAGTLHDCLKIEYAGGDRLFVPVENMEVLSRFGADEGTVPLDKLGGAGWQARKARVKKDLMVMADHLLKIAAARQLQKAPKLDIEQGVYNEFAARFPYAETEDQQRAITDVIADLSTEYPMDRLVCGDVGFGKTEVAIRAAYIAAMDGAQVALVVPTTLLARQHYQNFMKRFAGTSVRVAQLSRMVNTKDAKAVKDGLADGSVNIVIGTHALLAKGIKFANLGLLIIDEEQRFGVNQKERLKELKASIHVLTLTATPIPRTLQMALTGVKDMSLIATPPVDRLAIRTFVLPYDPLVIREALLREHYRGGQSFYVCPRIKDMTELERELKDLVPEIKIISAHGQMPPADLEDRMTAFYDGQYDLLLATNIIESGIDIPTANTMIIHRADMFGLAQLYQIRGRIGRSKVRAYAYLTYPPQQSLNPAAMKRLEVMETLDTLGAGFQLASHDMDIRGSGNLLGDQQSGHIREIGVELYQQMLEEAVAAAREGSDFSEALETQWSPQINIGTSVLIPETYVQDLSIRMGLYRRLADLHTSEDVESFAAELIDRFGSLPEEVTNLLDIVTIKQQCRAAGVAQVEAGPKGAVVGFHNNAPPHVPNLMTWLQQQGGSVKLRPDQKLVVIRGWDNTAKRVKGVQSLMRELVALGAS